MPGQSIAEKVKKKNPTHARVKVYPEPITDRCFRFFMFLLLALFFLLPAPSAYGADPSKVYFVPLPEEQIRVASATFGESGNTIHTIVSISVVAGNTTIYYDHWEDGYEADLSNPAQGTTETWTLNAGDILTLENDVPANPRGTTRLYDGGDKIGSTQAIAVTRAGWPTDPGTVLAGAVEVFDTSKWGIHYDVPVGEDSPGSTSFEYTGLVVMAAEDGTTVEFDTDDDGTVDITQTLDMGESYLVNGGIQVGAEVNASAAVQIDLITGDVGARFEGRWFTLIPDAQWADSYYNPVGTTVSDDPVYTILYNPDTSPITVNYETYPSGSGSFSVPAGGTYEFEMPADSGAHFYTSGSPFFALCLVDYDGSTHDWGFTLLPESALTTVAAVGWGPGSTNLSENGSPVWVTPVADAQVYVDYDGDPTTGPLTDPNGLKYDVAYKVTAFQSQRVFDNNDNNQTGMRLYTLADDGTSGALITAAWGQDPASAGPASPYLDLGTTVLPVASIIVQKDGALGNDINANGFLDAGDTIEYTIVINNTGTQMLTDVLVTDDMDPNTPYVPGTSTIYGAPISDNISPDTPFPFDESGFTIPFLAAGTAATITYQATVVVPLPEGTTSVSNRVTVVTDIETLDDSVQTPVHTGSGLFKQLYLSEPGQSMDRVDPVATGDTSTATSETLSSVGLALDDVNSVSTNDTDVYTITIPHTTGGGNNRLMLVGVSLDPNQAEGHDDAVYVGSVTYGASNLVNVGTEQQDDKARVEIWALVNPPAGPNNVVVNFWRLKNGGEPAEAKEGAVVGVATFTGVDQATPYGAFGSNVGDSDTPSVTISSAEGELVFDTVDLERSGDTLSLGPDQSELWRINDKNAWAGGSTEAGAPSVTMSWSFDNGSRDWAIGAISIKPASGYNTTTFTQTPAMCEDFSMSASNLVGVTAYIEAAQSSGKVTSAISESSDDAEEEGPDGTVPGRVWPDSTDVELVEDFEPETFGTMTDGFRFNDITIPPGATITSAYITYRAIAPDSPNTNNNVAELLIEGQAADDPATFTTAANSISSRPRTGAGVKWIPAAWTIGNDYNTPDLSAIVQELVDRPGWANGNSMVFIATGSGSRSAESWDNTGSNPPELTVEYTTGTLPAAPSITATLKHDGTPIHTFSNPAVTDLGAGVNRLEWSDVLLSDVTVPAGEQIELEITTEEPGISFEILYDSENYPSLVEMEADTVISVDTLAVYDAAYPGGSLIDPATVAQTVYVRATVSDPFGADDITSLDLSITDACEPAGVTEVTLTDTDVVDTGSCSKTYEYAYTIAGCGGTYTVVATANEGTEGVTDSETTTFEVVPNLDSFEDDYSTEDNFYYRDPEGTGQVEDIIYTGSLGFIANADYDVAYYDALGNWAYTDTSASADGSGFLRSTNPNTNDSVAYGTWTAVVFSDGAAIPATYDSGSPPAGALVDDTFEVVSWSTAILTDVNGNPVTEYQVLGGSGMAYFLVVDADQNTDPNTIETITITVSDSQSEDSETITLYETGPNTGVFANNAAGSRYGLPLSVSAGSEENDGTLQTYGDSTIHIGYIDPNDRNDRSGYDATVPTMAVIASFGAHAENGRVVVVWQTASENGTIGFHLERLNQKRGKYQRVNKKLLPGLLVSPQGGTYRFVDRKARPGNTYTYRLVEKEVDGNRRIYGPYTVTVGGQRFGNRHTADEIFQSVNVAGDRFERKAKKRPKKVKKAGREQNRDRLVATIQAANRPIGPAALGVNISVSAKGLYYLSTDDIAQALGASSEKVAALIKRGRMSLTNQGLPVTFQAAPQGSGITFYGEDFDSPYTQFNVYQLTPGKGKKVPLIDGTGPDPSPTPDGFPTTRHTEQDQWALTGLFDDPNDDYWLWDYLYAGYEGLDEKDFSMAAPGLVPGSPATLLIHLKGSSEADHRVTVAVNGTPVGEAIFSGTISHSLMLDVAGGVMTAGTNTVTLLAVEPSTGSSIVYLDSFDLFYEQAYMAMDNQLRFSSGGRSVVTVEGFSHDNIRVFDVTDPWNIIEIAAITIDEMGDSIYRVSLSCDNRESEYLALAEPAVKALDGGDLTARLAPDLKDTSHAPDYLVITPHELLDGAQRLADYRQSRGLATLVVLLQDIYDEFNYGIANPEAVRDFLEYAWHNWQAQPRYVVRIGEGTYDYKDVQGTGETLMPPILVATPWGLFASENRLADVDGSEDGLPEMIVGLLPADSSATLSAMIDKIMAYEASSGAWKNQVLMVTDNPDGGGNFPVDSDAVATLISQGYTADSIHLGTLGLAAARQALSTGFEDGAFLVNYFGHSGLDRLADEGLWTLPDVAGMTNQDNLPILVGMTCVAGRFEIPGYDAIAESLVVKTDGGAVAAWAPTGLSFNHLARVLDEGFFTAVFSDNETLLGDAILSALTAYKDEHPAVASQFMLDIYNLIGDPALELH